MKLLKYHRIVNNISMTIISVSLNEEYTQILDSIQAAYDLKGRSEAIRLSLDAASGEMKELGSLEGTVEGVLIIVRGNHADPWIIQIQARYQEYIKTQMHSHLMEIGRASCRERV